MGIKASDISMAALHAPSSFTIPATLASTTNKTLVTTAQRAPHIYTLSTASSTAPLILDLRLLRLLAIQIRCEASLLAEAVLIVLRGCYVAVASCAHLLAFLVGYWAAHLYAT